jgi:hypothetical protein
MDRNSAKADRFAQSQADLETIVEDPAGSSGSIHQLGWQWMPLSRLIANTPGVASLNPSARPMS